MTIKLAGIPKGLGLFWALGCFEGECQGPGRVLRQERRTWFHGVIGIEHPCVMANAPEKSEK